MGVKGCPHPGRHLVQARMDEESGRLRNAIAGNDVALEIADQ
jgi:hypothetical protein